jgi:hypothetical protein
MASATSEEESEVGTFSRNVELEQEEGANRKAVRGAGYGAMRDPRMKQEARRLASKYTVDDSRLIQLGPR